MGGIFKRRRELPTLSLALISLLVCGCASRQGDAHGYSKRSYFGWVEVLEYKKSETLPRIERVKTVGLRFQNGFSIGYFDDSFIELPMECHLVIVVKELTQLDHIFTTYPKLAKELKPCVKPLDY